MARVWEIELWSQNGVRMADVSHIVRKRRIMLERNEAGVITFDMDLAVFSDYCRDHSLNARYILHPYQTSIMVKRDGQYLYGFQVVGISFRISGDSETMTVTGTGFLNLFKDRYLTISYEEEERTAIAEDLVTQAQALTNGDVGVTIAAGNYSITEPTTRNYERQNVKAALQLLAELSDGRFDFEVTYDKQFRIVESLGALRADLKLVSGGAGSNIAGFNLDRMGARLYNQIIGLASGFGDDGITSVQDDETSQLKYYLRQKYLQWNSVKEQETLDANAYAQLQLRKDILDIPEVSFTGQELAGKPFITIGDRIPVKVADHPILDDIDGVYRAERITIDIDENDFESNIAVFFDDFGLSEEPV